MIMKIKFYIAVTRTKRPWLYELLCRRHERGLFLRPTMPNAILYTDCSYINIGLGTNFSTANFPLFNRFVDL